MKKLFLALMIVTPLSFADWGDVYYCQMTSLQKITLSGEKKNYKLEKFQFKLDKNRAAMVFGQNGYFEKTVEELRPNAHWPKRESWRAGSDYARSYFNDGKFLYSMVGSLGITSVSADCDKF